MLKPRLFNLRELIGKDQLLKDLSAGLIVGVIAIPLSLALARASGVRPEVRLVTAVVAGFIISFLGGSRVQIGGPTGASVVIVYGIIAEYGFFTEAAKAGGAELAVPSLDEAIALCRPRKVG